MAKASQETRLIDCLLGRDAARKFLGGSHPRYPLLFRGAPQRLFRLIGWTPKPDAEALIQSYQGDIDVHLGKGSDVYKKITLSSSEAVREFRCGATIQLASVEREFPKVRPFICSLAREMGIPPLAPFIDPSIFISNKGKALPWHFDAEDAITIQLYGTKKWRIAPNLRVANPTSYYTRGTRSASEELRLYCRLPLPGPNLRSAASLELKPGSVLYLPGGYWHSTAAGSMSLSFLVALNAPRWVDVLVDRLRYGLIQHSHWREPAMGAWGNRTQRLRSMKRLESLLAGWLRDAGGLDPRELISNFGSRRAAFLAKGERLTQALLFFPRPKSTISLVTEPSEAGGAGGPALEIKSPSLRFLIPLEKESVRFAAWLAGRRRGFFLGAALKAAPPMQFDDVIRFLELLIEAGALDTASEDTSPLNSPFSAWGRVLPYCDELQV